MWFLERETSVGAPVYKMQWSGYALPVVGCRVLELIEGICGRNLGGFDVV